MALRSNIPSAPVAYQSGVTATAGEVNYNDITAPGTVEATKTVIVDGAFRCSSESNAQLQADT